ncbi:hypothetical protein F7F11_21530 [Escherichia coli]|uniref:Prophage protein n=1 Tax=Escherichia coli TaxID=562 RepID=A0A5N3CUH0_ECOLX|nr:hypothetical protein [Escherichia coli]KAB0122271.1 hypothetical protein F7F11_21530 [Escherichia coli]
MDFDTIMEKAYEEYFEGLADGEEALSFNEFKQALSSSAKNLTADKRNSTARNQYAETRTRHHRTRLYR